MKRIACFLLILTILLSASGCGSVELADDGGADNSVVSNTEVDIDFSSVIRVEKQGYIPISTDSIKSVLESTGRFEISEFPHMYDSYVDVICELDKVNENSIASIFFTSADDNTAKMISYNFSKDALQGGDEVSIRWGLEVLMKILGDELTDDIWNDILSIAEKNESVGAFGTDYEGYSNSDTGIKLIYADLGGNVQIDIKAING